MSAVIKTLPLLVLICMLLTLPVFTQDGRCNVTSQCTPYFGEDYCCAELLLDSTDFAIEEMFCASRAQIQADGGLFQIDGFEASAECFGKMMEIEQLLLTIMGLSIAL